MLNPFKPLELVRTEVYSSMPAKFRKKSRTGWSVSWYATSSEHNAAFNHIH